MCEYKELHNLYKTYLTQMYTLIQTSLYKYIYVQVFDEINIQIIKKHFSDELIIVFWIWHGKYIY